MSGQDEALRLAEEVGGEIDSLKAELRSIDNVLARRPALADFGTRWEKVKHACSTAGRATDQVVRLEAALTAAAEREMTKDKEITRLTDCLKTANANHEEFERKWYLEQQAHEATAERESALREENARLKGENAQWKRSVESSGQAYYAERQKVQALESASVNLAKEVNGCLDLEEAELRRLIGHTNYRCLKDKATEVLALGLPSPDAPQPPQTLTEACSPKSGFHTTVDK